jgi:hypothetical protein
VRFAKRTEPTDKRAEGGAIRHAKAKPIIIDKKAAAFTKALYNVPPEEYDDFQDVETSMYSHYGGQISGYGARHDPPHVRQFVHNTLKQYPKLLHAYNLGRVVNPPEPKVPYRSIYGGRHPDRIHMGGSALQFTHSENGRLVGFDHMKTGRNSHMLYR